MLTKESVGEFVNKLGGIAYNKSKSPIDQEITYIKNRCKKLYSYWNDARGEDVLIKYVHALRNAGWPDDKIVDDLQTEVKRVCNLSRNWSQWEDTIKQWIKDIESWENEDTSSIDQAGTVIPTTVFENISSNIQSICKQINASYEKHLYDCTAVMMRRLLEGLLVLAYQKNGIEDEITEKNGWHASLDKIIKNACQNTTLSLSANTRKDMALFKDLGNYSAHKIWYNSTKQDIEPHILKYRAIIEELMYKAKIK